MIPGIRSRASLRQMARWAVGRRALATVCLPGGHPDVRRPRDGGGLAVVHDRRLCAGPLIGEDQDAAVGAGVEDLLVVAQLPRVEVVQDGLLAGGRGPADQLLAG